ncbi:MAG: DUF975 family protein [Bacilli bacterium]|nr:DUF975 family protein [Bacilli bacterium]
MDRVKIKEKAKEIIKNNKWNIWKPVLVIALISFLIVFVCTFILNLFGMKQELASGIASSIGSLIILPTTVGMCMYVLNLARGKKFSLDNLKDYYPYFFKIFIIDLLVAIFVMLWSILFIIPGIIAALAYSMVFFIAAEEKELSAMETISKSKEMMNGYKMDYFVFQLSFIGWIILVPFTLGILSIWLMPYMTVAEALFYDELKKKNK